MPQAELIHPDDSYKDCKQLLFSITAAKVMVEYTEKRNKYPFVFMSYPMCMPVVQLNALENQLILKDRIKYLEALYEGKKCNQKEKPHKEEHEKDTQQKEYIVNRVDLIPTTPNKQ